MFARNTQHRRTRGYNCKGLAKTTPGAKVNAVKLLVSAVIFYQRSHFEQNRPGSPYFGEKTHQMIRRG